MTLPSGDFCDLVALDGVADLPAAGVEHVAVLVPVATNELVVVELQLGVLALASAKQCQELVLMQNTSA